MGADTPDLVIVRKGSGIVVMNVFEEDLENCLYDPDRGFLCNDIPMASPLLTVKKYCDNIREEKTSILLRNSIMQKNGWYAVRAAVWFPNATRNQIESVFNEKSNVLALGAEDFNKNILDILDLNRLRTSFTDEAYKEFIRELEPRWHTFRDGDPSLRLRSEQAVLAESVARRRKKIKGVAGSGKTLVLASRAVNCQLRTGGDILILTYNITLVNYIRYRIGKIPADFLWSKFTISNYHRFFVSQAQNFNIKWDLSCFENEFFFEAHKDILPKYTAILIDEVQDYEYSWLKILEKYFLADNGEFILFGDSKQNIYQRQLDTEKEIRTPIAGSWNKSLNSGMRFYNPKIASLAMLFQQYFFPEHTDPFQPEFAFESGEIIYYTFPANTTGIAIANTCLNLIDNENLDKSRTVIVSQTYALLRELEQHIRISQGGACMTTFETQEVYKKLLDDNNGNINDNDLKKIRSNKKLHFTMDTDLLKISSIHSYKGWDAENVILIIQRNDDIADFDINSRVLNPELIYTAITRAKQNLFVINIGDTGFEDFFKNAQSRGLIKISAQFSEMPDLSDHIFQREEDSVS